MDKNDGVYPVVASTGDTRDGVYCHSGMTAQAYAAIHLKVTSPDLPDWLNEMIDRSRKDDFARAAMQGLMDAYARQEIDDFGYRMVAQESRNIANAMMEESK
jgi:hypothetical protein